MKQKARLKAIQKAAKSKTETGRPVTEVIIYGMGDNGETRHLATMTKNAIYLPDNGRGDNDHQKPN